MNLKALRNESFNNGYGATTAVNDLPLALCSVQDSLQIPSLSPAEREINVSPSRGTKPVKTQERQIKPALVLLPQTKVHQFSPTAAEICHENQSPGKQR